MHAKPEIGFDIDSPVSSITNAFSSPTSQDLNDVVALDECVLASSASHYYGTDINPLEISPLIEFDDRVHSQRKRTPPSQTTPKSNPFDLSRSPTAPPTTPADLPKSLSAAAWLFTELSLMDSPERTAGFGPSSYQQSTHSFNQKDKRSKPTTSPSAASEGDRLWFSTPGSHARQNKSPSSSPPTTPNQHTRKSSATPRGPFFLSRSKPEPATEPLRPHNKQRDPNWNVKVKEDVEQRQVRVRELRASLALEEDVQFTRTCTFKPQLTTPPKQVSEAVLQLQQQEGGSVFSRLYGAAENQRARRREREREQERLAGRPVVNNSPPDAARKKTMRATEGREGNTKATTTSTKRREHSHIPIIPRVATLGAPPQQQQLQQPQKRARKRTAKPAKKFKSNQRLVGSNGTAVDHGLLWSAARKEGLTGGHVQGGSHHFLSEAVLEDIDLDSTDISSIHTNSNSSTDNASTGMSDSGDSEASVLVVGRHGQLVKPPATAGPVSGTQFTMHTHAHHGSEGHPTTHKYKLKSVNRMSKGSLPVTTTNTAVHSPSSGSYHTRGGGTVVGSTYGGPTTGTTKSSSNKAYEAHVGQRQFSSESRRSSKCTSPRLSPKKQTGNWHSEKSHQPAQRISRGGGGGGGGVVRNQSPPNVQPRQGTYQQQQHRKRLCSNTNNAAQQQHHPTASGIHNAASTHSRYGGHIVHHNENDHHKHTPFNYHYSKGSQPTLVAPTLLHKESAHFIHHNQPHTTVVPSHQTTSSIIHTPVTAKKRKVRRRSDMSNSGSSSRPTPHATTGGGGSGSSSGGGSGSKQMDGTQQTTMTSTGTPQQHPPSLLHSQSAFKPISSSNSNSGSGSGSHSGSGSGSVSGEILHPQAAHATMSDYKRPITHHSHITSFPSPHSPITSTSCLQRPRRSPLLDSSGGSVGVNKLKYASGAPPSVGHYSPRYIGNSSGIPESKFTGRPRPVVKKVSDSNVEKYVPSLSTLHM